MNHTMISGESISFYKLAYQAGMRYVLRENGEYQQIVVEEIPPLFAAPGSGVNLILEIDPEGNLSEYWRRP